MHLSPVPNASAPVTFQIRDIIFSIALIMRNRASQEEHQHVGSRLGLFGVLIYCTRIYEQYDCLVANFTMFKSISKSNLEGDFQCRISLLDDTELSCDFKVRI